MQTCIYKRSENIFEKINAQSDLKSNKDEVTVYLENLSSL